MESELPSVAIVAINFLLASFALQLVCCRRGDERKTLYLASFSSYLVTLFVAVHWQRLTPVVEKPSLLSCGWYC